MSVLASRRNSQSKTRRCQTLLTQLAVLLETAKGSASMVQLPNAEGFKDSIRFATKHTSVAKKNLVALGEKKNVADGDFDVTSNALAEDTTTMRTLHQDCMEKSEDFEAETKSRGEELLQLPRQRSSS